MFQRDIMKTKLKQLLVVGASSILLAGCCTTQHVTRWEYKVVDRNVGKYESTADWLSKEAALMNELGKDGWIFVGEGDGMLYFKRPQK